MDWLLRRFLPTFNANSSHTADMRRYALNWLVVLILVFVIALAVVWRLVLAPTEFRNEGIYGVIASIVLAVGGVALTKMQAAGEAANRRQGVVDIFRSDMISICRVMYSLWVPKMYVTLYEKRADYAGVMPTPGIENYLNVFQEKCSDLVLLDKGVVQHVTAFYRYFLSSRDSTRRLQFWPDLSLDQRVAILSAIMTQLGLCFKHAREAINLLDSGQDSDEYREDHAMLTDMIDECVLFYMENPMENPLFVFDVERWERLGLPKLSPERERERQQEQELRVELDKLL